MLTTLERQLHVLGGLNLLHGAGNIKSLGIMRGVGLVSLGLHIALNKEAVVVEVARVAGDAIVAAHILGAQTLLASHERLIELLAMAGADHLGTHMTKDLLNGLGKVADSGSRGLLHEEVARVRVLERELDQVDCLIEVHEEAGHIRVGDRKRLTLANAVDEQRDDGATGAHNIAVAGATDGGAASTVARVGVDDGLHHRLGLTHRVDGVGRLIGGKAHDLLHALGDGGMQHVVGADDVGAHGLHGKELAGRNLLQCGGVENVVHAVRGVANRLGVAHVADQEPHLRCELGALLLKAVTHIVLLLLITREDANFLELGVDEVLEHGVAEAARAARDHKGLASERSHLLALFLSLASSNLVEHEF